MSFPWYIANYNLVFFILTCLLSYFSCARSPIAKWVKTRTYCYIELTSFFLSFYMWSVETVLVAVAWMLAILSALLGLDRMIRIVMGNYLINSILLWLSNFIELISHRLILAQTDAGNFLDKVEWFLSKLLLEGRPTILLTVYFLLLLFVIKRAHIWIWSVKNEGMRAILTVLFIPSTVLSILLSMATAIFWSKIMDLETLEWLAALVIHNEWLYQMVLLTPLRIVLPGIFIIFAATMIWRDTDEIVQKVIVTEWYDDDEPLIEVETG